ncbi:putative glycylpeptide n-tetradecanoyltransferase protein [Balamuthia mandrillaris]
MADEDGSTTTQQEVAASPCCPSSEQQATLKAGETHDDAKEKAKAKENDSTNEVTPHSQKSMTTSRLRRKPFRATSFHRERSWNLPHSEMFAKHDHCPALALRTFSHRLKVGERRGSPCTLCYQLFGHGPKKLLFIMGYVTSSQVWAEQVAYFAQPELGFQVCIFDNRGYPSSPSHRSMCFPTMEEYAKDTLELLDHLGWSRLHLVGFSMGGMVAQVMAALQPERFITLTLAGTHAGGRHSMLPLGGVPKLLAFLRMKSKEEKVRAFIAINYSAKHLEHNGDKVFRWHFDKFDDMQFSGLVQQTLALLTHYVPTKQLLQIKEAGIPVLVLTGTADLLVKPKNSEVLSNILDAKLSYFEGAGHMLNSEDPVRFNQLIHQHILSFSSSPSSSSSSS